MAAAGHIPTTLDPATSHVRLLLVDDNPAVLRQVFQLLPREFEIVGTLEDGAGLRDAVRDQQPDIIVLDVTLPQVSGIALASQLSTAGCAAKIVFLTVHSDPDYVRAAFAAGAAAYVVKTRLSLDIVLAFRAVLRGERFISASPELEGMD
jgi:DNA-binding NarL/FixJ family response regulator